MCTLKRLPCINYNLIERDHLPPLLWYNLFNRNYKPSLNAETLKYCSCNTKSYWWILWHIEVQKVCVCVCVFARVRIISIVLQSYNLLQGGHTTYSVQFLYPCSACNDISGWTYSNRQCMVIVECFDFVFSVKGKVKQCLISNIIIVF